MEGEPLPYPGPGGGPGGVPGSQGVPGGFRTLFDKSRHRPQGLFNKSIWYSHSWRICL